MHAEIDLLFKNKIMETFSVNFFLTVAQDPFWISFQTVLTFTYLINNNEYLQK